MTWTRRQRARKYVRDAFWIAPTVGLLGGMGAVRLTHLADVALGWYGSAHPDAVQTVLITLAAAMLTFIVFVCSILLVALQLASAQLTPRIIGIVYGDPFTRLAMMLFTFAFAFTVGAAVRVAERVPWLTTQVAIWSAVVSLGVFFGLIGYVGRLLRPSHVLRGIARRGRKVIEAVYPRLLGDAPEAPPGGRPASPRSATVPAGADGVILACDVPGIVELARQAGCVLEMVPKVGDFVAKGSPLFHVHGDAARLRTGDLSRSVAIGQERSLEQDPAFAFRIIVDIASKALSPAINDPTTAVLAIDQLHYLLRQVGRRALTDDRVRDATGQVRLIQATPNWEDFVRLAVTEIRHFGGDSIQIARRLRAMLENLVEILPEPRAALLRREVDLLRRSAARHFEDPEDRALAEVGDSQGVGGRSPAAPARRDGETPGDGEPG